MTLFYSHGDGLCDPAVAGQSAIASTRQMFARWLRAFARRSIRRTDAAFRIIHRAIVAAKLRRLRGELMFHAGPRADMFVEPSAHEGRDPDQPAAKFPQPPLLLGDKWDF